MSTSVSFLSMLVAGTGAGNGVRLGRMVAAAASAVVVRGDRLVDRMGRGLDERRAAQPYGLYWNRTQNDHFSHHRPDASGGPGAGGDELFSEYGDLLLSRE